MNTAIQDTLVVQLNNTLNLFETRQQSAASEFSKLVYTTAIDKLRNELDRLVDYH